MAALMGVFSDCFDGGDLEELCRPSMHEIPLVRKKLQLDFIDTSSLDYLIERDFTFFDSSYIDENEYGEKTVRDSGRKVCFIKVDKVRKYDIESSIVSQ